jgi:hypothetical protein
VPLLGPSEDLRNVLALSKIMESETLGRGRWLLAEPAFQSWLAPREKGYLLVDAHSGGLGYRRSSPVSVFAASLAVALDQTPGFLALHHFCGQHYGDGDALAGPAGVLRGLVAQLLQHPGAPAPGLEFVDAELWAGVARGDVLALAEVLFQLVRQLGKEVTVYVVVDNVNELENTLNGWSEALRILVQSLVAISEHEGVAAGFKVLLTCENRSTEVVHLLPADRHVALRAGNVHSRPMALKAFEGDVSRIFGLERKLSDADERNEDGELRVVEQS